jgi:hypothetical protein
MQRGKEYALNRMDTVSLKEFITAECSKVIRHQCYLPITRMLNSGCDPCRWSGFTCRNLLRSRQRASH